MGTLRTTVYLEADLNRALKLEAAEAETSLSELVNRAVRHFDPYDVPVLWV